MADVVICDDILHNILARLPGKALLLAKCVSTHWNRFISDPSFMKSISRRMILVLSSPSHALNETAVVDDLAHSMVKIHYPYEKGKYRYVRIIGTFNGIVLLAINDSYVVGGTSIHFTSHMILLNPFTGASKILLDPYSPFDDQYHVYGFGYGATQDELKIFRFRDCKHPGYCWNTLDVFNLKTSSWSTSEILIKDADQFRDNDVGTFLNGFLYWVASHKKIVALNVNDMLISDIHLPYTCRSSQTHLGTLHGYLCMIVDKYIQFDVWVMKEQGVENSWSKVCWFKLGLEVKCFKFTVINIMDDGRILMAGDVMNYLVIYDISKHSYKILKSFARVIDFATVRAIGYEESLISPSHI